MIGFIVGFLVGVATVFTTQWMGRHPETWGKIKAWVTRKPYP